MNTPPNPALVYKHEGGFAFPGNSATTFFPGMSLRDYFAAQALIGLVGQNLTPIDAAVHAYNYADAMLEEKSETIADKK